MKLMERFWEWVSYRCDVARLEQMKKLACKESIDISPSTLFSKGLSVAAIHRSGSQDTDITILRESGFGVHSRFRMTLAQHEKLIQEFALFMPSVVIAKEEVIKDKHG